MIKLFLLIILLMALGVTSAWLADHPGDVTMYWLDYRIDTSVAVLIVVAIIFLLVVWLGLSLLKSIIFAPKHISEHRRVKRYALGLSELTASVAALAASDFKAAEKHTHKAQKFLGTTPLTLLLSAQIARHEGDDAKTKALLEAMLEHGETEYLAARLLSEAASKQKHFPQALALAERAHHANPKGKHASQQIMQLYMEQGEWQEALHAINQGYKDGALHRTEKAHARALVFFKQAQKLLAAGKIDSAIFAINEMLKCESSHAGMVRFAAEVLHDNGNTPRAITIIERAWKTTPHPALAEYYKTLTDDLPPIKQRKRIKKLEGYFPFPESTSPYQWDCATCHRQTQSWDIYCPSCHAFDTLG